MQRYSMLFAMVSAFFMQAGIAGTSQATPSPQPANACSFQPPTPVLSAHAYSGQSLERQSDNRMTEKARLPNGLRIDIRQSACADVLTTEFILRVPEDRRLQLGQDGWIRLAQTTIAELKTHKPAGEYKELDDFLRRAQGQRSRDGTIAACRDGSDARPGECTWESLGGFVFSVKRAKRGTRVLVTQYVSA